MILRSESYLTLVWGGWLFQRKVAGWFECSGTNNVSLSLLNNDKHWFKINFQYFNNNTEEDSSIVV